MDDYAGFRGSPRSLANLKPFAGGADARRNLTTGPLSQRRMAVRRELAKLDPKAFDVLTSLLTSDDINLRIEGMKFWGKYRLPVPTEEIFKAKKRRPSGISPELAVKIAELDEQ